MFKSALKAPGKTIGIFVDGKPVEAIDGESIAGVLMRIAPYAARTNPVSGASRAPYCMMGVCFECLVAIDGLGSVQSCMTFAREGMRVERQMNEFEVVQ